METSQLSEMNDFDIGMDLVQLSPDRNSYSSLKIVTSVVIYEHKYERWKSQFYHFTANHKKTVKPSDIWLVTTEYTDVRFIQVMFWAEAERWKY